MNASFSTKILWFRVPVWAVPVHAVLHAQDQLDALEKTLLRLVRLSPQSLDELHLRVGMSAELVESALSRLVDLQLVASGIDNGGVYSTEDVKLDEQESGAMHNGWVFLHPSGIQLLPRVWLGRMPPDENLQLSGRMLQAHVAGPDRVALPDVEPLRQLVAALPLATEFASSAPVDETGEEGTPPGQEHESIRQTRSVRVRALFLAAGSSRSEQFARRSTAWVRVDLVPRWRGPALPVFHELEILPGTFPGREVSSHLAAWVQQHAPEVYGLVEAEARLMFTDSSIVLQRAGLESEADLERLATNHFEHACGQWDLRKPDFERSPALTEPVREGVRWFILAGRHPDFVPQARDRQSHAIENIMRLLREAAVSALASGPARSVAMSAADVERRLDECGLGGKLGPSLPHLVRTVAKPQGLHELSRTGAFGAGMNLTLWLLPLLLGRDSVRTAWARVTHQALSLQPDIFALLDDLVRFRNDVFHGRIPGTEAPARMALPEEVDRTLLQAYAVVLRSAWTAPEAMSTGVT